MLNVSVDEKCYQPGELVIQRLEFRIGEGEKVALVGPSGAGKSTLLNLISGLDREFRGAVTLNGRSTVSRSATNSVSMMFQDSRLMPWLSVWSNVMLVAIDNPVNRQRARNLLDAVGLDSYLNLYPAQLSGGMKKRVSLARAFMAQPSLLLMDEPFASLDAPSAAELRELVKRMCDQHGTTLLYVTHDLAEAVEMADRVLFFSTSPMKLILDHTVSELKQEAPAESALEACSSELLRRYPGILHGVL